MTAIHGISRWCGAAGPTSLDAGDITEKVDSLYRPALDTVEHSVHSVEDAGDDLVRILMKLTSDVERFDSMVVLQRKMLQESSAQADSDDERLSRQSERLRLEAAEIVADAHQALDQLRRLSQDPRTSRPRSNS